MELTTFELKHISTWLDCAADQAGSYDYADGWLDDDPETRAWLDEHGIKYSVIDLKPGDFFNPWGWQDGGRALYLANVGPFVKALVKRIDEQLPK